MTDQYLEIDEAEQDVSVEAVIGQVLSILAGAKSMPLSSSIIVSREEVTGLLRTALDRLPDELRQARWLLREREEFMAERSREAEALMDEVRAQAEHMVQRAGARDVFAGSALGEALARRRLTGVVRAWLSQNAKDGLWFPEHNSAD